MPLTVRPIDFDSERDEFIALLERNLPDVPHAQRFDWLYRRNPAGQPLGWFLYDSDARQTVGSASLFPRRVWFGTESRCCAQVGDFSVDPTYRSLGPALLLQRATFKPVDAGDFTACYDCPPDDRGMTTFQRLGMTSSCRFSRYVRPLRVNRRLAGRLRSNMLEASLSAVVNQLLRLRRPRTGTSRGIDIGIHHGRFDDEFSRLDESIRTPHVVRASRDAADLNWRYREDPLRRYRVFTARRHGELLGFAVLGFGRRDAYLADCFGSTAPSVVIPLLEAIGDDVRSTTTIENLYAVVADEHPLAPLLRKALFFRRPFGARVVAYFSPACPPTDPVLAGCSTWHFTQLELFA